MDHFECLSRRHNFISKLSAAFFYALAVAVALNFFWHPGKIYASGVTGFSQVLESLSSRYLPFTLTTSSMYFVLNIPLFILGWLKIGKKFTLFTI
ncbi:MAG: YitT family protein, partial [Lactobacillus iners]|nr:YitT family protein [Lactobacillus iners]